LVAEGLSKFSWLSRDIPGEFAHPDLWASEDLGRFRRIAIGASKAEIPLMLSLCRDLDGPFMVMYVLVASRLGNEEARYESDEVFTHRELETFLLRFRDFFEQDGRHHVWIISKGGDGQLIFDNHNVIYAYGRVERFERRLVASGFEVGEVEIPFPHEHNYHAEFDTAEEELLNFWPWTKFPLQSVDL
jgi:hypothetical protein